MPEASLDAKQGLPAGIGAEPDPRKGGTGEDKGQFCAECLSQSRCHRLALDAEGRAFQTFSSSTSWGTLQSVTPVGTLGPGGTAGESSGRARSLGGHEPVSSSIEDKEAFESYSIG